MESAIEWKALPWLHESPEKGREETIRRSVYNPRRSRAELVSNHKGDYLDNFKQTDGYSLSSALEFLSADNVSSQSANPFHNLVSDRQPILESNHVRAKVSEVYNCESETNQPASWETNSDDSAPPLSMKNAKFGQPHTAADVRLSNVDSGDRENIVLSTMLQLEEEHREIMQRKQTERKKKEEEEEIRMATMKQITALEIQLKAIDVLRSKQINERTRHAAENIVIAATKVNQERETLSHLRSLAKVRVENKKAYFRMGSLFFFFLLYVCTILVQKDISVAFGVESR